MEEYIKNPKTGRQIRVGGPTYANLLKEGVIVSNRTKHPVVATKNSRPYPTTTKGPSESRMTKTLALSVSNEKMGKGPGAATRGWLKRAPERGDPRKKLYDACGEACFLGENMAFPICPSCETYGGKCECQIDCNGANAAFARAQQFNYSGISKAAQRVLREKCNRTPKARKSF